MPSAHIDRFVRDRVPAPDQLPSLLFDLPGLQFAAQLNCASELLDRWVLQGQGARLAVLGTAPDGAPIRCPDATRVSRRRPTASGKVVCARPMLRSTRPYPTRTDVYAGP